jgi:hypothetical protein
MCEPTLARAVPTWPIPFVLLTLRIACGGALLVLLACLGGCAGGQTGEESGGGCVFTTSPLSRRDTSELGFSAESVLSLVQPEQRASFEWVPGAVAYGPERGTGEVTVRITARGDAQLARIVSEKSADFCEDHLRIPLEVELVTAGGAFHEAFRATLVASRDDEAAVTHLIPSAALRGTFAFSPEALAARRFLRLEVNLRFAADGFAGYLFGGLQGGDEASGVASYQPVPLACWEELPGFLPCPP